MLRQLLTQEEAAAQFDEAISVLRDDHAEFTADTIYGISDLAGERRERFFAVWDTMPVPRRRKLIKRLVETSETNFDLDFSAIVNPAVNDTDPEVRQTAISGVLEDAPPRVIRDLLDHAQDDPLFEVRAAAAKALGPFVLKGELGKLPDDLNVQLQDTMWALYNNTNEALDVRRRALEAISNCGREGVNELIREAYYADDLPMRISSVFAMGKSCDDVWLPLIMDELDSEYPAMRYEAARAAGELELRPALPRLAELVYEGDREIQEAAVWALGEIGGDAAKTVLNNLAALADDTGDVELAAAVAEAQGAATLAGDEILPLFDFSDYEDDEKHMHTLSLDDLADEDDDLDDLDPYALGEIDLDGDDEDDDF